MGAVTPYGPTVKELWNGLSKGISALKYDEKLGFVTGQIRNVDISRWSQGQLREMSRASVMALLAAEEAVNQAKASELNHEGTLVNIGTCMADLEHIGEAYELVKNGQARKVSPYFVPRILSNLPAGYVAMKYKMKGGVESTSTACATGLHCIGGAFRAVRDGYLDAALAGASECAVNSVALNGFDRMRALAKGTSASISRPFDEKRSGFVLSEGAGLIYMETIDSAEARGVPILAEILGYGVSSDAHHISVPDSSGVGAALSMERAVRDGKLDKEHISYINAHATSTPAGDAIEAKAIQKVFGNRPIPVSSFKGHIGHLLGAAGSVETIGTISSILHQKLAGNLNLETSKETVNLVRETTNWESTKRVALVNSFGFGSTNASLLVGQF